MTMDRRTLLIGSLGLGAVMTLPGGTVVSAVPTTPDTARSDGPWVYWYWLDANVTTEGIHADLDAMHQAGIAGVILFNIKGKDEATLVDSPVESHSPRWWSLLRLAADHAEALGLSMAINICDGWATAGGAWVTPEQSAQELVWAETLVEARGSVPRIAKPASRLNYYHDVATFAFPVPEEWDATSAMAACVTTSWGVANPKRLSDPAQSNNVIDEEDAGWIQFSFPDPFMLRSVTVRSASIDVLPFVSIGYNGAANSLLIEASDDGQAFRPIHHLASPQLGWQANLTTLTHSVPPTRARHFRFRYDPQSVSVISGHDGHMAVGRKLALASLELLGRPVVDCRQVRTAEAWGKARSLTDPILHASDCIKRSEIVDISSLMEPSGTCSWRPPDDRRWAIWRIGATTNGKTTDPSGRMGGLECDKFDPAMAALQFDRWFGEARRQMGPELAGKVLTTLHMDSWEGRGQNWSGHLRQGFGERRGYDIGALLLTLAGVPIDSASITDRFLFDWRRTIGELLCDNFFATVQRLAYENGCLFSSEAANASFPSDGLAVHRHADIPCGEFWRDRYDSDKPSDIHEAVCAARLYGKRIAAAEAWTGGLDWSEHPFSFKAQGDQNFCRGINRFILHVWVHQAFPKRKPGITLFGYGSFFSETQPWWPMAGAWIDYISRCQTRLQEGVAVADIGYFMGEDIPARALLPDALEPALPPGYSYDSVNADALWTLARVANGRVSFPSGASYAVLVLPPNLAITYRTALKLKELVAAGAILYGPRPSTSPSLQDAKQIPAAQALIDDLWGKADGKAEHLLGQVVSEGDLATLLRALDVRPDVETQASDLLWTHRSSGARDTYFLSNQGAAALSTSVRFRTRRLRAILYDPVTDVSSLPPARRVGSDGTVLDIDLAAGGSAFVLFEDGDGASGVAAVEGPGSGATPRIREFGSDLFADGEKPGNWRATMLDGSRRRIAIPELPPERGIDGPWRICFDNAEQTVLRDVVTLRSWTEADDPAVRFHSGTAVYRTSFHFEPAARVRWQLLLGRLHDVARVTLNEHDLGIIWAPGTSLDATAALVRGENRLTVIVANSWRNRLIGDARMPDQLSRTWILENHLGRARPQIPDAKAPLLPAGLIGEVRLAPVCRVRLM